MSGAVAIFVKTPGLSPVKTRLTPQLGQDGAESFHLAAAGAVREVTQELCRQQAVHAYYAVAEQAALNHVYWRDLPCLWQGDGGLGDRMASIYQTLLNKHDFVILIGADIPQMTVAELLSASAWLDCREMPRMAFGPSADGGFWLFGGNCAVPWSIWTGVTYSMHDTGSQFYHKIKHLGAIKQVALLQDVDEPRDLSDLRQALLALPSPLPAQHELLRLLPENVFT